MAGNLHFTPFSLTVWAVAVTCEPLCEAWAADESLAVAALGEIFQHIRADAADELLDNFTKFRLRIVKAKLLQFVR